MANLSSLKIRKIARAFADVKAKHNALVGLIESLEGSLGVDIQVSYTPPKRHTKTTSRDQPRGKIRVGLKPNAVPSVPSAASANELHFNDGTTQIDIDANGIKLTDIGTGNYCRIAPGAILSVYSASAAASFIVNPAAIFRQIAIQSAGYCDGGAKSIDIPRSNSY